MKKNDFYLAKSDSNTQEKESKKKFSNAKPCKLFTNFTIFTSSFCLVLHVALISLFFIYIIIYTIFTIYDNFYSILSLNDARDTTNFTTYVLQIGMSPITKNNFKHLLVTLYLV